MKRNTKKVLEIKDFLMNRSGGIRTRYPSAKNSVFTRVLDKIF